MHPLREIRIKRDKTSMKDLRKSITIKPLNILNSSSSEGLTSLKNLLYMSVSTPDTTTLQQNHTNSSNNPQTQKNISPIRNDTKTLNGSDQDSHINASPMNRFKTLDNHIKKTIKNQFIMKDKSCIFVKDSTLLLTPISKDSGVIIPVNNTNINTINNNNNYTTQTNSKSQYSEQNNTGDNNNNSKYGYNVAIPNLNINHGFNTPNDTNKHNQRYSMSTNSKSPETIEKNQNNNYSSSVLLANKITNHLSKADLTYSPSTPSVKNPYNFPINYMPFIKNKQKYKLTKISNPKHIQTSRIDEFDNVIHQVLQIRNKIKVRRSATTTNTNNGTISSSSASTSLKKKKNKIMRIDEVNLISNLTTNNVTLPSHTNYPSECDNNNNNHHYYNHQYRYDHHHHDQQSRYDYHYQQPYDHRHDKLNDMHYSPDNINNNSNENTKNKENYQYHNHHYNHCMGNIGNSKSKGNNYSSNISGVSGCNNSEINWKLNLSKEDEIKLICLKKKIKISNMFTNNNEKSIKEKKELYKQLLIEYHPDKTKHEKQISEEIFSFLHSNKNLFLGYNEDTIHKVNNTSSMSPSKKKMHRPQ